MPSTLSAQLRFDPAIAGTNRVTHQLCAGRKREIAEVLTEAGLSPEECTNYLAGRTIAFSQICRIASVLQLSPADFLDACESFARNNHMKTPTLDRIKAAGKKARGQKNPSQGNPTSGKPPVGGRTASSTGTGPSQPGSGQADTGTDVTENQKPRTTPKVPRSTTARNAAARYLRQKALEMTLKA